MFDDSIEDPLQVEALPIDLFCAPAGPTRAEENRKIEYVVSSLQADQQIKHLVDNLCGSAIGAVYLVDHDYRS